MISKKEHPSTQGVYKGQTVQGQKLQESRKSRKEKNDWFRKVANQFIKVLKKNNFRFGMDLSISSKHLLFLSLQRHHNKQWGTINHIYTFRLFYLSFFSQQISLENFAQHQFWHQARCSTSAWVFSMPNKK